MGFKFAAGDDGFVRNKGLGNVLRKVRTILIYTRCSRTVTGL